MYDIKLEENSFWKSKKRDINPLHKMCSRICSFPPLMPRYFIEKYSNKGDVFLDIFSGKGTAPLEAALLDRKSIGNDVSPEAHILTYAKLNPIKLSSYKKKLTQIENKMGYIKSIKNVDPKVKVFYNPTTLKRLIELKTILKEDNSKSANFIKGVALGLLHGNSQKSFSLRCSHSYSMSPTYVKKYAKKHGLKRPRRDIIEALKQRGEELLINNNLKYKGRALNSDSRDISLKDCTVDLAFFSPPYLNIQTYAYDNWLRHWFLGYDYKEVKSKLMESGSLNVYSQFMKETLVELKRVMKPGGNAFVVVGDVKNKRVTGPQIINMGKLFCSLAKDCGFKVSGMMTDKIPVSKKVLNNSKQEGIKIERIVHLNK